MDAKKLVSTLGMAVPQPELGRRIRAAMNYGEVTLAQAAALLNVNQVTISRWYVPDPIYEPTARQLELLAKECGVSPDFFSADFYRLDEIVPAGRPRYGPLSQEAKLALDLRAEAQRSRARRKGGRGTTDADDGRKEQGG